MRYARVTVPLLAVTLVAGCSSSDSQAPDAGGVDAQLTDQEQALYTEAKDEPSLTWYSGNDPVRNDAVIEGFLKRYPDLEATSFRLASGELASRYSQERTSGVNTAGLIAVGSPEFVAHGQEEDWWEPLTTDDFPELADYPEDFVTEVSVTAAINVFGIGYNTTLVTDPPSDWEDVLDPGYTGEIVFGDPRNVPGYVALGTVWMEEYGEDFLSDLAAQDLTVVDSMVPGIQQVGAGEGALGLPSVLTVVDPVRSKGAPLEMVFPDVTTGNPFDLLLPTDGPSPNTARLLLNYILSEEGQSMFNGTTGSSPINAPGTAELPSGYVTVGLDEIAKKRDVVLELLGLQE